MLEEDIAVCLINAPQLTMKKSSSAVLLAAAFWLPSLACAGSPPPEENARIPTVTKLVKEFWQREADIIAAFKNKDDSKLTKLVDPDFEMQVASGSASAVPFSDWVEASKSEASSYKVDISDMAVHDLGQTAIVSYNWKLPLPPKSTASYYVVDVWKSDGKSWKLALRFIGGQQKMEMNFPGAPPPDSITEKKY